MMVAIRDKRESTNHTINQLRVITHNEGILENRRCSVNVSCSASWLEESLSKLSSGSVQV